MRVLFRKTLRDLRAALAQSAALTLIVALGIASFVALAGSYRDLSASYNRTYEQLRFADVDFSVQAAPENTLNALAKLEGVAAVTGRLIADTGLDLHDGEQIRARLIGISADRRPAVNDVLTLEGRFLDPSDARFALLESHFANYYDRHPGDTITPIIDGRKTAFDVVGVVASPEYLIVSPSRYEVIPSARTFAVLFVPLPELQTMVGAKGVVNDIAVHIASGADRTGVVREIEDILRPYQLLATTLQEDQPSNAALKLDLDGYRELADLMPGLILAVGAASIYVMLGRLVRAQQPQIGLMKALGYSNLAVMSHYLAFALTIGVIGSVLGVLFGLPLVRGITGSYATELGIPLVETRVHLDLIGLGVFLSLFFSILAGLGPARASARLAPAIAMRMDPAMAMAKGRTSLLELVLRPPIWLRLPLRNVFRVRRRSATTGLGIVFAYVLVLSAWGMFDSMAYLLKHNFEEVERWDMMAIFEVPQTNDVVAKVRSWEGVKGVEPFFQVPATLKANGKEEGVLLTALNPSQTMHSLQLSSEMMPDRALADGGIVVTPIMADKLRLRVGDRLTIATPLGERRFILSSTAEELAGEGAFISLAEARALIKGPVSMFNGLYLRVTPDQAKAIKADLYHLPGMSSVQQKADIKVDWESLMGLFYVFMGIILLFALAMAFALLFNAMTVNVLERERELATMRAFGTDTMRIALLITAESVTVWLITLVPGLVLGWWVAMQMGAAFSSDLIAFKVVIYPASYAFTAMGILLTMMLAALPAIRRVNRLNLAEATKILF